MMIEKLQADAAEEPQRVWSGVDRIISKGPGVSSPTVSLGEKLSDLSDPSSLELIFLLEENILDGHCSHTLQETEQRVFPRTTDTRVGGSCQSACGSFGFQEESLIIVVA